MTEAEAALMRARLHLRGGRRRLQKGLSAAGIVALYDSVLFGMRYYVARHERYRFLVEQADLWDAAALYHALARAGVFEDPLAFNRFSLIVEQALWQGSLVFDADATLAQVEGMLRKLGVIPFRARSTRTSASPWKTRLPKAIKCSYAGRFVGSIRGIHGRPADGQSEGESFPTE